MNTILFGHPAVEPAAYARGLADQLWRKAVDMMGGVDAAALRACLAKDGQIIALNATSLLDPAIEAVFTDSQPSQRVYLQCRPEVLAARCGDEADAMTFTEQAAPVCRRMAGEVFDVSELTVDNGLRYLIRQCM